jgi:HK97 gp10 family phage protein
MKIDVDINDDKLMKSLEQLDEEIIKEIRQVLIKDLNKVKSDAKRDHRFNNRTGKLQNSIRSSLTEDKNVIDGFVYVNDKAVPYAKFIHNGTKKIKADPFISDAMNKNEKMILKDINDAIETAIKDSKLN